MYYKIINDRMVFNTGKYIVLESDHLPLKKGQGVSNPSAELLALEGWQVYVPPVIPPQPQTEPGMDEVMQAVKKMLSTETEELSDEDALEVAAAFKTWESAVKEGKEVPVGKRLWYDGKLWKVIIAHVPMENWTPDTAVSLYVEVSIEEIPAWRQPVGSADAYMTGDKVKHVSRTWESLVDNNVWEPGSVGTESLWQDITPNA